METTLVKQEAYSGEKRLYMPMELSSKKWVLLFGTGGCKTRQVTVAAGDAGALQAHIEAMKRKFGLPPEAPVVSCYEAGRDGFWIHHLLLSIGVENHVVPSTLIPVDQRAKRAKTDPIDVRKLMTALVRFCCGDVEDWSEVRVPTQQEEDERRLHRERDRLKKERTALGNSIGSLLATYGVRIELNAKFEQNLQEVRRWNGEPLPPHLMSEVTRSWQRRELVSQQLHALEQEQCRRLADVSDEQTANMRTLMQLRSLGVQTPWVLCTEIFNWRQIANRRQLGALAGLTPTPYNSGDSEREQGISKAGNRRVRRAAVELAWSWLRLQPDSELTKWFQKRFATGKRTRRIGIVAVARKLLVALWRYLNDGVIPAGAGLKTA